MSEDNRDYSLPFPTRLRTLMEETGTSQYTLADAVSVTRQAVAQWKDGKTIPDMYNFKKLADFFEVSYDYLFGVSDSKKRENIRLALTLGLSDGAIEALEDLKKSARYDDDAAYVSKPQILSEIIGSDDLEEFLRLVQSSAVSYRQYQEYVQRVGMDDIFGIEHDEARAYTSEGKAVISATEMKEYHQYRACELMKKIMGHIPENVYEDSIGIREPRRKERGNADG